MKIKGAAILLNGSIHWGTTFHASLWFELFELGKMPKAHESQMTKEDWAMVWLKWGAQEGFVTTDDEFMDREQAAELALQNGQAYDGSTYRPNELHVPDLIFADC